MNPAIEEFYYLRLTKRLSKLKENSVCNKKNLKSQILIGISILILLSAFPNHENNSKVEGKIVTNVATYTIASASQRPNQLSLPKENKLEDVIDTYVIKNKELNSPYKPEEKEEVEKQVNESDQLPIFTSPYNNLIPEKPKHIEAALVQSSKKHNIDFEKIIIKKSNKYGMDSYLILRQLYEESGFNPKARSSAGAYGIAQFILSTGKKYGLQTLKDFFNPEKSIDASIRKMKDNYFEFKNSKLMYYGYNAHGKFIIYTGKPRTKKYSCVLINPTKDPIVAYKYALAKYNGGDGGVLYFALRGGNFTCNKNGKFSSYSRQTGCYVSSIMPKNYKPNITK